MNPVYGNRSALGQWPSVAALTRTPEVCNALLAIAPVSHDGPRGASSAEPLARLVEVYRDAPDALPV